MSNYPIWWDSTITIYNKYTDNQTHVITWHRHVLHNCFWKSSGSEVVIGQVTLDTASLICRIPENPLFKLNYLWMELPNDQMGKYFTINEGDIVVYGEVTDDIDEYENGHRSSDLIAKYKARGCIEIQQYAVNVGVGRNNPHYFIRGT